MQNAAGPCHKRPLSEHQELTVESRCRIKCDRKVPCGSCRRKQCASLCPNDVLKQTVDTTNPESRPLLEEIDQLKSQVAEMTQRIRELEEGLATSHAFQSSTTHPLLKLDRQRDGGSESPDSSQPSDSDFVSAMGTLTVSNGEALYFGATACPETVLFVSTMNRTLITAKLPLRPKEV